MITNPIHECVSLGPAIRSKPKNPYFSCFSMIKTPFFKSKHGPLLCEVDKFHIVFKLTVDGRNVRTDVDYDTASMVDSWPPRIYRLHSSNFINMTHFEHQEQYYKCLK